jgi:hypothetical protein
MKIGKQISLLFILAGCCLAVRNPDWKLGTVLDSPALHQAPGIETPVYSPAGKAVRAMPQVQRIEIQGTQRVILGASTVFVVDPGPNTGTITVGHGLMTRDAYVCQLGVRDQIMYSEQAEKKGQRLQILDSFGHVCSLDIVRQEQLQASTPAKSE